MAHHRIITRFEMTAPVRHVWSALVQPERWIHGWDAVTDAVALDPGDGDHVGTRHAFRLQAARLARLDFETEITRAERPDVIEWTVRGDLEGTASWELDDLDELTIGRNIWEVRTAAAWLNASTPVARRSRRRLEELMRTGHEVLAAHLDGSLLSSRTSSHRPERHRLAGLALRIGPGARDRS